MSQPPTILIVPGWRDSGPGHWQSLWAESIVGAVRVQQDNWISPTRNAWVSRIAETIQAQAAPVVLVGPIARLELIAAEGDSPSDEQIIEAQIPASQFYEQGFTEGETLVLTPRKARVFVE